LGPHVRLDEIEVLFFRQAIEVLLKCSFVMTAFCSDVSLFQDDFTVVAYGALDL